MGRRFAIFVLLGPFLAWLTAFVFQLPALIRNPSFDPLPFYGLVLGIVMIIGFVPAFALACADQVMARKALPLLSRAVACALLAYPVTLLGAWIGLGTGGLRDVFGKGVFMAGLFGMIPAAVCSWLAGRPRSAQSQAGSAPQAER
jgi:hypothetical protein